MKQKKLVILFTIFTVILSSVFGGGLYAAPEDKPFIMMELDKTKAAVGEIIRAEVKINNIKNFMGYQVAVKYDPEVLQAFDLDAEKPMADTTKPMDGDILINNSYTVLPIQSHNIEEGILSFGKSYISIDQYKNSGTAEETGVLAVLGFKVLKEEKTVIQFTNPKELAGAVHGTLLFNWNGEQIKFGYSVIHPQGINGAVVEQPEQTSPPEENPNQNQDPSDSSGENNTSGNNPEGNGNQGNAGNNGQNNTGDNTQDNAPAKDDPEGNKSMLFILGIGAVALILAVGLFVFFTKKSKE